MKKAWLLTGLLIVTLVTGNATTSVWAASAQQNTQFSVTVPTILPISVDEFNNTTVSENMLITNNSPFDVIITSITKSAKSGWTLTTSPTIDLDKKEVYFNISTKNEVVPSKGSTPVIYDAKLSPQLDPIENETVVDVIFVIDWNEPEYCLQSIYVATSPSKTAYKEGETFDPTNMVVNATYTNGAEFALSQYEYDNSPISQAQTSIELSYTEKGITKTTDVAIEVLADEEIENPSLGTKYEDDFYEYSYGQAQTAAGQWADMGSDSWGVRLKEKNPSEKLPPPQNEIMGAPVTNLSHLFSQSRVVSLDFSDWSIPNINNTSYMFANCQITTLNLSGFNASGVTNMQGMFKGSQITILDLSSLNTSGVISMESMFEGSQVAILNLDNVSTTSVNNMSFMFQQSIITNIDISSFDMSNVANTTDMFTDCVASKGYARTNEDANILNSVEGKPHFLIFITK